MIKATICGLLLLTSAFAQGPGASSDGQEGKLIVLEHMWNEAQVHRDSRALEALIADHFVNTEYDGEVSGRGKFLADIEDPLFKPTELSLRDVKVNVYRDTAVVVGVYHARGTVSGKPYDHTGRFTDTWIFDGGRWMCVASHTSLLRK